MKLHSDGIYTRGVRPWFRWTLAALWLWTSALAGCSDQTNGDNDTNGANNEADLPTPDQDPTPDAEPDAVEDTPEPDAAPDVEPDAIPDAEPDAEPDATPDAEPDAVDPPDMDTPDAVDPPDVPVDRSPVLLELSPTRGPVDGGVPLLITGENFTSDARVLLGLSPLQRIEVVSDTQIIGLTPPGLPGAVDVKVITAYGDDLIPQGFTYFEPLDADSIDPASSPTEGGTEATLRGSGFTANTQVLIHGRPAIGVTLLDDSTIQLTTPPGPVGLADVRVIDLNSEASLPDAVRYFEPLSLDRVLPAAGPRAGGDTVTLHGAGMTPGTTARFGTLDVPTTFVDENTLTAVTPPGPLGFVNISLHNDNGVAGLINGYYYFAPNNDRLAVYGIGPSEGPVSGGQEVVIIGERLNSADLRISLGGRPVQVLEVTPTTVTALTPPGERGLVDLEVSTADGEVTLEDAYTWLATVAVEAVEPASGPLEGGNEVVIRGQGFGDAPVVFFGALQAEVTATSDTALTVIAPPGSLATVDVEVRTAGLRGRLADAYTWTQPVEVFGLRPTSGSISGNTLVVIRGQGFLQIPAISFGRVPVEADSVTLVDSATLQVRTPPNREGAVDVTLDFEGQTLRSPDRYTYFNPGTRFGGVWGDQIEGTVNVSVYSQGGGPVDNAFVTLSVDRQTPFSGFTNEVGQVTFSGQNLQGRQSVTAVAAGFSSATVQSFNAQNVTVFLSPLDGQGGAGGGPPTGTITGTITGVEKIGEPGPNEFELAVVYTTTTDPFRGNPPTGNGNVVLGNGEYTLTSRVGDVAVIVVAGLFNNRTETFTPLYMGIRRYLFVSQNQTYRVDLEANIPLNHPLRFKLTNPPRGASGPNINRVIPYLDLGFEGTFGNLDFAEGQSDIITAAHMPALAGELADASYFLLGGAWTGQGAPYSLAIVEDVTDIDGLIELPPLLGVPSPLNPTDGGRVVNDYVEFSPNSVEEPDFYFIEIEQLNRTPVWTVILPGNEPFFQLPQLPDFRDLPREERPAPFVGGLLRLNVTSARAFEFDYDNFEYNDFGLDNWEVFTSTGWLVQLR